MSRQSSVTRTFENENNSSLIKAEDMVFTPFGPTPSQGRGNKKKGKVGSIKGYQVSSSDQKKSSSLLDLSLLSESLTPSLRYSSTQNSVESDQSEYQYVAFQQESERSESVQLHIQQQLQQQQQHQTYQSEQIQQHQYNHQNIQQENQTFSQQQQQDENEIQQQQYSARESDNQEKVLLQEFHQQENNQQYHQQRTKQEALKKIEAASPKSYNQSPFSFKRPTAFNKANGSFGSFGSQLNLASMNEEKNPFKIRNFEEKGITNSKQQAHLTSEINLQSFEEQSVNNSYQSMQESAQFTTTTECSKTFSQESKNYESSIYSQAQNFEESKNIESTNIAESNEGLTFSNDVLDERDHFSAVCRYETSKKSFNGDKDKFQAGIEREDDIVDEDDVKEYSVEAKIILNPNTGENEVNTWDSESSKEVIRDIRAYKTENKSKDKLRTQNNSEFMDEILSLGLVQPNFHTSEISGQSQQNSLNKEESFNQEEQLYEQNDNCEGEYERMEESEMNIDEAKVEYSREENEVKDYSELFIKEEQKTVINSCIEELEKSTVIDNSSKSTLEVEKEYEDVNFETEKIIDNEDLEHVHVKSWKNEERRLSFQHLVQTSDIIQICKQVDNIIEEKMMEYCLTDTNLTTKTEIKDESCKVEENALKESAIMTDIKESIEQHQNHVQTDEMSSSFFLTETESDGDLRSRAMNKRQRNRTIDYHNLPSLYWEASVQNYHEKKFTQNPTETVTENVTEIVNHEVQTEDNEQDTNNTSLAKDGLSIILQKYKFV